MNTSIILLVAIVAVVLVLFTALLKRKAKPSAQYESRRYLLSKAERSFFGVLETAASGNYRIMAKVRVGDILKPSSGMNATERTRAFNRISAKHIDFILCTPDTLEFVCAIELDDKSHEATDRRTRDDLLNQAFADAQLPLLRVPAKAAYNPAQLQKAITSVCAIAKQ